MESPVRWVIERQRGRRFFFKTLGATAVGASVSGWLSDEDVESAVKNVQRNSIPSQLKITDLRVAVITGAPMNVPLIRIDTNQGISGYGALRDGGSKIYALILKSRILCDYPCNVAMIFLKINRFGGSAR